MAAAPEQSSIAAHPAPRPRKLAKRLGLGLLALLAVGVAAFMLSPWPSVWVIRTIFDSGARTASAKLERHLPDGLVVQTDIAYDPADPDARLDIYRPRQVDPARPVIVWIHGGGFVSGRKEDLTNYLKVLAGHGYGVVNVDYTVAPTATYPTPVRQFAKALAFVAREGAALGLPAGSIVVAGDSAGAQIAAQTANLVASPDYAAAVGIPAPLQQGQLAGALLYCGVFDLGAMRTDQGGVLGWFVNTVTWSYSGKRDWHDAPGMALFSVARHVTPAFPPAFISAGNADPLAPQSQDLAAALRAKGVAVDSLFYPPDHPADLAHEYQFDLDTPDGRLALERSLEWLAGLEGRAGLRTPQSR